MKKMILTIGLSLVAILLAIAVYNALQLQHIKIKKSVVINSDIEQVFDNVVYLNNFPKWSPFYEADPKQKIEIKGEDGKIGAQFHWESENGKELGFQEIKAIEKLKYIKMECQIEKPFQAVPTFEYTFNQQGNSVTVTQDFNLKSGFIDAFFMGIFGAKKEMETMNARGLELLKNLCEK